LGWNPADGLGSLVAVLTELDVPKPQTGMVTTTDTPTKGTVIIIRPVKLKGIARNFSVVPKFLKCKYAM
jgi:hypothetical protein